MWWKKSKMIFNLHNYPISNVSKITQMLDCSNVKTANSSSIYILKWVLWKKASREHIKLIYCFWHWYSLFTYKNWFCINSQHIFVCSFIYSFLCCPRTFRLSLSLLIPLLVGRGKSTKKCLFTKIISENWNCEIAYKFQAIYCLV